jgi:lysophospholipase
MNLEAPLIGVSSLPVPEGGRGEWYRAADGARLRAALFPAKGKVRGSVVLSPGRTEPLDKYFEVVGELQDRGFVVLTHDWRGQGLSDRFLADDRLKGHATGAQLFLDDYTALLDAYQDRLPKPWIQVAHSMGGCLALLALVKGETRFAGSALSAPMLGVVSNDAGYVFARALTWSCAHLGLGSRYIFGDRQDPMAVTFEKDRIAHDRRRWERFREQMRACPDLQLGNLTWGWLDFAMSAGAYLRKSRDTARMTTPVLIVAAVDDDRVLTADARKVAERLPDCRLVVIDNAWHEILMETDDIRAQWWAEFDAFAGRHVAGA